MLFLHNSAMLSGIYDVEKAIQNLFFSRHAFELSTEKPFERLDDSISFGREIMQLEIIPPNDESIHMAIPYIPPGHPQT